MFDQLLREGLVADDDRLLRGEFDREFEPEFADGFWDVPIDGSAPPPLPTMATCAPSGWSTVELDTATADPAQLSDAEVIEAIVGFDRVSSWAAARQARLMRARRAWSRRRDPGPCLCHRRSTSSTRRARAGTLPICDSEPWPNPTTCGTASSSFRTPGPAPPSP